MEISLGSRLRATRRRISDLDAYIADLDAVLNSQLSELAGVERDIEETDRALSRAREAAVVPDTRPLIEANEALSSVLNRKRQAEEYLALRTRARGEGSALLSYIERVEQLQKAQAELLHKKRSPEDVVSAFSIYFGSLLKQVRFPDGRDAYVDKKSYHPIVRGQSYGALSSKGAVSLVVACWHLALLQYSLEKESLFPRLLLLDSPLSHVGQDAKDSEFRDQKIVDALFEALWMLHEKHSGDFQILLTINRPPATARGLPLVEFTGDPNRGRYGLIDDEVPPSEAEETAVPV